MCKQDSKETLEILLDTIPDYIFYKNLDGKITYCNKNYADKVICRPKIDIYGKTYEELNILQPYFNTERIRDKEVIESARSLKYEQTISKQNKKHIFEISKYPTFDEENKVNGILGIIREISNREELSRLREGFFANVSHEFRTPINMIITSIQLLEKKCELCDLGICRNCFIKDIQRISINTLRILKISNNFIDLTNIQAGNMEYNPQNYDIVNTIESICEDINKYKKFKNIDLIFDTEIEEKVVSFDKIKLERVILNLISNAIKFNHTHGEVIVSISLENKDIKISVKDTGIGILESDINSIFNGFSNVEDRFTKICEGCGVGLALTKYLIEMHQGTISVISELGKGSEFIVSIPDIVNEDNDIVNEDNDTGNLYNRVHDSRLERIKMEFSDIYE